MTTTLKDLQQGSAAAAAVTPPPPPLQQPVAAAPPKHRLSCTACSTPGNHRYAGASQQASPSSSRRNSHLKTLTLTSQQQASPSSSRRNSDAKTLTLTPPSNFNSSQDSLITHRNHATNNDLSAHSDHNFDNIPHTSSNVTSQNLTLDLPSLSSSSSLQEASPGFNLKFNTHHSQPRIKCHIDHLDHNLELDVKLDGCDDNNNEMAHKSFNNSTRFTLNCYDRNDPNKMIKLRVELVKTSAKGFGLKIFQHMPPSSSSSSSSNGASIACKKEKCKRNKSDHSGSRRDSVRSESSRSFLKSNDSSESEEMQFPSGEVSNSTSKLGDDTEDHCRCTTPCGAPGCKGTKLLKE